MKQRSLLWCTVASTTLLGLLLTGYVVALVWRYGAPLTAAECGDMLSGFGAIVSVFALGGVVLTLLLQRRALGIQQRDLQTTQQELRATKEIHREHLEHLEESERRRLTLQLSERYSSERMVFARQSLQQWLDYLRVSTTRPRASIQPPSNSQQIAAGVRSFVDFLCDGDAMASAGLLDRGMAFALIGRQLIGQIYDLENSPANELLRLWPDWSSIVHPRVQRFREYLQTTG